MPVGSGVGRQSRKHTIGTTTLSTQRAPATLAAVLMQTQRPTQRNPTRVVPAVFILRPFCNLGPTPRRLRTGTTLATTRARIPHSTTRTTRGVCGTTLGTIRVTTRTLATTRTTRTTSTGAPRHTTGTATGTGTHANTLGIPTAWQPRTNTRPPETTPPTRLLCRRRLDPSRPPSSNTFSSSTTTTTTTTRTRSTRAPTRQRLQRRPRRRRRPPLPAFTARALGTRFSPRAPPPSPSTHTARPREAQGQRGPPPLRLQAASKQVHQRQQLHQRRRRSNATTRRSWWPRRRLSLKSWTWNPRRLLLRSTIRANDQLLPSPRRPPPPLCPPRPPPRFLRFPAKRILKRQWWWWCRPFPTPLPRHQAKEATAGSSSRLRHPEQQSTTATTRS
mmetsp:Transcript_31895/g.64910  ORF Transcript_31895/g.64910 Transcript_31895/m.64910 type:complete len:389 (+) Transcript_31895:536-1702(+)